VRGVLRGWWKGQLWCSVDSQTSGPVRDVGTTSWWSCCVLGGNVFAGDDSGADWPGCRLLQHLLNFCCLQARPVDFDQRLHLHQLHERCEQMCLLTQLFAGPDPACGPSGHVLADLQASAAVRHNWSMPVMPDQAPAAVPCVVRDILRLFLCVAVGSVESSCVDDVVCNFRAAAVQAAVST